MDRRIIVVLGAVAALALGGLTAGDAGFQSCLQVEDETPEGSVPTTVDLMAAVEAVFRADSYAPGGVATLVLWSRARGVTVQVFHSGPETKRTVGYATMEGVAMTRRRPIGSVVPRTEIPIRIGKWASGLYFARLTAADGRIGFAPFVVRPAQLGTHRVAVVIPTQTWQAYNFRDENGDKVSDTWYADSSRSVVELVRPFLDRGVPPHFRQYDLGFLNWIAHTGKRADFFSDADLDRVATGDALANAYRLIVFPGHEEYITTHEFDVIERFHELGGNLAFLSANAFFYRVVRHGDDLVRAGRWRDLGRPEAALIGVQYLDWNNNCHANRPFVVTGAQRAPWVFKNTGLTNGSRFGTFGIEIDATTHDSPPGLKVLAQIPNTFGPGKTATMTYYSSKSGAQVFAAGAFTLGGAARWPTVATLLDNLWARLAAAAPAASGVDHSPHPSVSDQV
jgi:hypothetical protein